MGFRATLFLKENLSGTFQNTYANPMQGAVETKLFKTGKKEISVFIKSTQAINHHARVSDYSSKFFPLNQLLLTWRLGSVQFSHSVVSDSL